MNWILSWLTGGGLNTITKITGQILDLQAKKVDAKTQQEKDQLDAEIGRLQLQQNVLLNENEEQRRFTTAGRLLFVFPASVIVWKLLVWDNTICRFLADPNQPSCLTEKLSPDVWWLITLPMGFLFVARVLNR